MISFVPKVWEGILEGDPLSSPVHESYFCKQTLPDRNALRPILGGGQDETGSIEDPRIDVDASLRTTRPFERECLLFPCCQLVSGTKSWKREELTVKRITDRTIICGAIEKERRAFSLRLPPNLPKARKKPHPPFLRGVENTCEKNASHDGFSAGGSRLT
jgi:hypothetical protein